MAQAVGLRYRTAHRWVSAYRRFGLGNLARKKRTDRGSAAQSRPSFKRPLEVWPHNSRLCQLGRVTGKL